MTNPAPESLVPRHPVASPESLRSTKASIPSVADGGRFLLTRSGRSAIAMALRAAGLVAGDRVLVPDYYCPTMIAPVEAVGAKPVFYPLTARGAPDLEWLDHSEQGRGGALLAAHFFGLPITMQPLRRFCDQRGLVLIEDCAHAYFGSHEGVAVGATGDYAIASLPKFHAVPEGGLLVYREGSELAGFPAGKARASAIAAAWHILEHSAEHHRLPVLGGPVRWLSRQRSRAQLRTEGTDGVRP
ncbi:MAG: DegT/DnrJ/EryC1/StrS family aminotransferase, partial [Steroidobacteraceae bacterium]